MLSKERLTQRPSTSLSAFPWGHAESYKPTARKARNAASHARTDCLKQRVK